MRTLPSLFVSFPLFAAGFLAVSVFTASGKCFCFRLSATETAWQTTFINKASFSLGAMSPKPYISVYFYFSVAYDIVMNE